MKKLFVWIFILVGLISVSCSSTTPKVKEITFEKPLKHFVGLLPAANAQTQYQLDLFENKTYFIRTFGIKNGVKGKSYDDIGSWEHDEHNRIVLKSGREAPQYFYVLNDKTLELMDLEGKRIDTKLDYKLKLSDTASRLEPRVFMSGMFRYMADAAIFEELITGVKYPVAMEEDYLSLERAYIHERKVAGESIRTYIDGQIMLKNPMEGDKKVPTVVVKKFINIDKKSVCINSKSQANLTGTYWKLVHVSAKEVKNPQSQKREAHMVLFNSKLRGNSGCNSFSGNYVLDENNLSLADKGLMMTRMFCKNSIENDFLEALRAMKHYKVSGECLEVFDENLIPLARFESVYLY